MIHRREPEFDLHRIPDDDPAVFQMLAAGRTSGVFQVESAGMTECLQAAAPHLHRRHRRHQCALPSRPYGFDPAFHCLQGGSVPDPL